MNVKDVEIQAPWGNISLKLWGHVDDPAILTVHGIMDNAGSFDGLIPLLPQNYFYICVDLPGHGRSGHFPPHLPIYTTNYIIVYTLIMEHFKRDKYIIMAHSYGAQIGFLYAQMYPDKVEKLIMLDTVHMYTIPSRYFIQFLEDKVNTHFSMENKMQTRSAPQYTYEEALDRVTLKRSFPITEKAAKKLLNRMLVPIGDGKYQLSQDQRLKNFINPMHDHRYVIETIKENPVMCPILIVFGLDNSVQRRVMRPILDYLKKQKNVITKYVPGHHDVHQTNPELVAPYIEKFLNYRKSKL